MSLIAANSIYEWIPYFLRQSNVPCVHMKYCFGGKTNRYFERRVFMRAQNQDETCLYHKCHYYVNSEHTCQILRNEYLIFVKSKYAVKYGTALITKPSYQIN